MRGSGQAMLVSKAWGEVITCHGGVDWRSTNAVQWHQCWGEL